MESYEISVAISFSLILNAIGIIKNEDIHKVAIYWSQHEFMEKHNAKNI